MLGIVGEAGEVVHVDADVEADRCVLPPAPLGPEPGLSFADAQVAGHRLVEGEPHAVESPHGMPPYRSSFFSIAPAAVWQARAVSPRPPEGIEHEGIASTRADLTPTAALTLPPEPRRPPWESRSPSRGVLVLPAPRDPRGLGPRLDREQIPRSIPFPEVLLHTDSDAIPMAQKPILFFGRQRMMRQIIEKAPAVQADITAASTDRGVLSENVIRTVRPGDPLP